MITHNISIETETFFSLSRREITLTDVLLDIKTFLEQDCGAEYSLVIGTDSHERIDAGTKNKYANLITAIVVHRKGFGGKYFWQKKKPIAVHSLRGKIYAETLASLEFATQFVPLLKKKLNGATPNYLLEIHVDVGEHGATREMIKEVVGMVHGNGFVAKTKPYSYAASSVADKHT